ncbi:GMC family oxidoreductase [Pseudomonas sp. NY15181]|uniref:GMC family oxidoreductase n=1 Tax=Pseudomonas sp. NY15181 TaxID=3400349 RepID=UPI003A87F313
MPETFDYVIVGAGSAGCALAARLSEQRDITVLLIEAGPNDASWRIDMPLAVDSLLTNDRFSWPFKSEPLQNAKQRVICQPRGRVLGGSSSINGMVYTRGHPLDYDHWANEHGCKGWSYADVLPYFKRMEHAPWGDPTYRGINGPIKISRETSNLSPLSAALITGGVRVGLPYTSDYNGQFQEGITVEEQNIAGGKRCSAARGYLTKEVRSRPNLRIWTGTWALQILIESKCARGVLVARNGKDEIVYARRETILCSGSIGSPHLLMLSGIGPAKQLIENGIKVVHDNDAIGGNLQDHPLIKMRFRCKKGIGLSRFASGPAKIVAGLNWFLFKTGVTAKNHFEAGGYVRTNSTHTKPNVKFELFPLALTGDLHKPYAFESFQIVLTSQNSQSRGKLILTSNSVYDPPKIELNYLDKPEDFQTFTESVALTRKIIATPEFQALDALEIDPGPGVVDGPAMIDWVKDTISTAYHTSGTCRMGPAEISGNVVDPQLRVIGIENLRVADASIQPVVVSANTNATSMMIGERAADLIRMSNYRV